MDRFTEIMKYLLQEQTDGNFSPKREEIRQAEQAFLLTEIREILEREELDQKQKLERIKRVLQEI